MQAPKYGISITPEDWRGWPLRSGHFGASGSVEALTTFADTVIVWNGGGCTTTISWEGKECTFTRRSGDVDLIPAGVTLDRIRWEGAPAGCVSAVLPTARLEQLAQPAPRLDRNRGPRFALSDAHVVDLVQRLVEQALQRQPLGTLYVEGLSTTLASYVSSRYSEKGEKLVPLAGGLSQDQCEKLLLLVDERLGEPLTIESLAQCAGYSKDHFGRLFKNSFGMTPHRYVLKARVERAKALLQDKGKSLAEVASNCGFASQAHMSTAFKHVTGFTPGAFRRR